MTAPSVATVVLVLVGLSGTWVLLVPLLIAMGFSSTVFTANNSARLQLISPPQLRGRVMSINTLLFAGSTPIGSLIVGGMAEDVGVQPTLAAMGGLCCLGVVASLVYLRRKQDRLVPAGAELSRPAAEERALRRVSAR